MLTIVAIIADPFARMNNDMPVPSVTANKTVAIKIFIAMPDIVARKK